MTVIAGVIQDGTVWMGCDSLCVNNWYSAWDIRESKLFRTGPFLMGVAGYPRVGQLIRYKLGLQDDSRKSAHEFMCVDFVDRLRQIMQDNGTKRQENNTDELSGNSWLLVGFRGMLFEIQPNFQVEQRTDPFDAIGCGGDLALGSLHETSGVKGLTPRKRIERALKCAERFSSGVRGPFVIERA